jgi:3-hydroxybutyryl-CoA dehydrogenase
MKISNVTIAGAGNLGSQIAWQAAFNGFNVIVFDAFEKGLETGKVYHQQYAELFLKSRGASLDEIDQTMGRLSYTLDLAVAVKDADIVSESIPENLEVKRSFYQDLSNVAPEKTIFTTNSSTITPSEIVSAVDRPEKFLALHFANGIWDANVAEVMGHAGTDAAVFEQVVEFARSIGMVSVQIHKEHQGYVLDSLLIPLLSAAGTLYIKGVVDYESIDKTWMISTASKMGPFGIMDIIGMQTIYDIEMRLGKKFNDQDMLARAEFFKTNFLDKGKLGVKSGEGFYKYPDPAYRDPDFLK